MTISQFSTSKTSSSPGKSSSARTGEAKFVVAGATLDGTAAEVVVKVGFTGKLIVITAYVC